LRKLVTFKEFELNPEISNGVREPKVIFKTLNKGISCDENA